MFVKTKDIQRFIVEQIDFDKKSLKNIKGARLPNFGKIKAK